ncbi:MULTISPECIES: GNAT family N-acetyltransferase [unclassified Microbacterium]|uniref:GNAT family N-acetyltransferase n=1 Tax=unclassified Microbacterium TaxID=2609290 RepID=UPI0030168FF9
MPSIRPFRPGDEPALAEICRRTADSGGDATGILDDDEIWAAVFVLPYVARHPDLAFVVEADDGRVIGYVVGTDDTRAFEEWFATRWWPGYASRWPNPGEGTTRQDGVLAYAYGRRAGAEPFGELYPAHLHIDLLPEAQGQGWGRRLIETLVAELRRRGVSGLHLATGARNAGAIAFYARLGFVRLPSPPDAVAFGMPL